jgi:tetratricopeptide (TPR) repeat protein
MRDEIKEIAHTLCDHNPPAIEKYNQIINVLKDSLSSSLFIQDLESEMSNADCLYCDEQPFCRFYITFAYYKQDQIKKSKEYLEEAIEGFRMKTMDWNEAMAHWLLGEILIDEKSPSLAQRSLERATRILEPIIKELKAKSNYDDAKRGEKYISKIQATLERVYSSYSPSLIVADQLQVRPPASNKNETAVPKYTPHNTDDEEGYIIISSIPIYEEVEAGPNGPVWADYLEVGNTEVHHVVLQGKHYKIFSTKYKDRSITISSNKKFAWARIHGHSMNAAHPVPIDEGDYVLFYQADKIEKNEIVIVAKADNSEGNSYMVKRYSADEVLLKSETLEHNRIYEPIPVTANYRIIGIVVAIAKPAQI